MSNPVIDQLQAQIAQLDQKIETAQQLLHDPEMQALAEDEITSLTQQKQALETSIKDIQSSGQDISTDENLNANKVTLEIRGGAGGEEAKIWADDLLRMYTRFFETKKFSFEA